jgi:hypothetical protein
MYDSLNHGSSTRNPPGYIIRPAAVYANYVYIIKMPQWFRQGGVPSIVIFSHAACEPAHNKGCGRLPQKFGDPWSKYYNGQNGENDPGFSICLLALLSTELFCHSFVRTGEFRCLSLDIVLNLSSGFLNLKRMISIAVTCELKLCWRGWQHT